MDGEMLSAFPAVPFVAAETRAVEAVQPEATPRQVSLRKIFCVVPGVSVVPSVEASTNTPKRWLALSTGKDSDAPGTFVTVGEPGVNKANASLLDADSPGVTAVIWFVPVAPRLAAGMKEAMPPVPIKMVAGSGLPFQLAIVQGDNPFPFRVSAMAGPVCVSVAALVGDNDASTGVGRIAPVGKGVTENGSEFEFVPAFAPETVMAMGAGAVARNAVSAAVIAAVSCVALTKVVGRGEPFQLTVRPFAKPVPVTVRVRPDRLQKGVLFAPVVEVDADNDVTVGNTILNWTGADTLALDAGLATVTWAVPTEAISAAGIVATNSTGFPAVAAR